MLTPLYLNRFYIYSHVVYVVIRLQYVRVYNLDKLVPRSVERPMHFQGRGVF